MTNYIIAGEAGSPDLADCEYLGKKLEASTPDTHVHIISKHTSEWDDFLKKICSGYGFKEPSNPIIFTVDGKFIGDKHAFKEHILQFYSVKGDLDKSLRTLISEYDKTSLENQRQKIAEGPSVKEKVRKKIEEIVSEGGIRILDSFFEKVYDKGFEFHLKKSKILSPFYYDNFEAWGEDLSFLTVPELVDKKIEDQENYSIKDFKTSEDPILEENLKVDEEAGSDHQEKERSPSMVDSPLISKDESPNETLMNYEIDDNNIKKFIEYFTKAKPNSEILADIFNVTVPAEIRTIPIFNSNIVKDLINDYILALSPFPLIPEEMVVFSGKMIKGGWLLRDPSMMQN